MRSGPNGRRALVLPVPKAGSARDLAQPGQRQLLTCPPVTVTAAAGRCASRQTV